MENDYTIRLEQEKDFRETENLVREAFWNVYRPGCLEHYVIHSFRGKPDFVPELDFVMERDGKLVGQVMYVRAKICSDAGKEIPIMTFGPISVMPELKGKGLGSALLRHSMDEAKRLGAGALAITGDIGFYGRLGFSVASSKGIGYFAEPKGAEAPYFLICELSPGFLDGVCGVYKDPEGYFVDENEAEAFDAQFPKKEKLKLPGQLI